MRNRVATGIFDITLKMFLRDNFVHSDMHAGNAIYDEKRDLITLIDAGMATELPQDVLWKFGISFVPLCWVMTSSLPVLSITFTTKSAARYQNRMP